MPSPSSDSSPRDPLDLPATPARMRAAVEALGLSPAGVREALVLASAPPPAAAWNRFLSHALLLIGAGLLLAGIVCFFAFNWADLHRFAKFALLQAAVAVCAVVGWWRLRDMTGRVALSAAAVLVGPLLGVYGQTYQTGADPWSLFSTWALLIAPWVLVAQFTALWMIEIALLDVALTLFWIQVPELDHESWAFIYLLLAGIHVAAVAIWEWQRRRAVPWLDELWAPRLLGATAFGLLLIPSASVLLDLGRPGAAEIQGFIALCAAVAGAVVVYRWFREDLFMLTAAGGSVLAVLTMALGRLLFAELKLEESGALLMAVIVIVEVVAAVAWLRRAVRSEAD